MVLRNGAKPNTGDVLGAQRDLLYGNRVFRLAKTHVFWRAPPGAAGFQTRGRRWKYCGRNVPLELTENSDWLNARSLARSLARSTGEIPLERLRVVTQCDL